MTSTIKVNNVQNQCGQNIINENSNTITIGASGDTIALASGASQTGFGRTGTVNWVTTKKTANFTATSGEGYFCDTSGGAFTLTLPSSPSAGDIVGFKDYSGDFATNNLTIGRGGSPINGGNAADVVIETNGASIFLVYVDATQGWVATQDDSSTFSGATFMVATGGTITTCGNDKIHTFTGPGTFTVCTVASCAPNNVVSYLVVAGGGGSGYDGGGGGGAGGYREVVSPSTPYTGSPTQGYSTPGNRITVTATGFPITVGAGGTIGSPPSNPGTNGSNSIFSSITSAGGGGGSSGPENGSNGGSGGGSWRSTCSTGGTGNTPPVTPAQGTNGGSATETSGASGGGGATAVGTNGSAPTAGPGGAGATSSINGTPTARAGGGGGGADGPSSQTGGTGGAGGGGTGGKRCGPGNTAGTANTGGGAGGGGAGGSAGLSGGSGIVIIRYRFQ